MENVVEDKCLELMPFMRKGRGIPEGEMADAIICSEKGVSGHNGRRWYGLFAN